MADEENVAAEPPRYVNTGIGIPVMRSVDPEGKPTSHLMFTQQLGQGQTRSGTPFALRLELSAGLLVVDVGSRQYSVFARDLVSSVVDLEEKEVNRGH